MDGEEKAKEPEVILQEIKALSVPFTLGSLVFETLKSMHHQKEIDEILSRYERDENVAAFYEKYNFLVNASAILELNPEEMVDFYVFYFSKRSVANYIAEFKKDVFAAMFSASATDDNIYIEVDSVTTVFRVLNKLLAFEKITRPHLYNY